MHRRKFLAGSAVAASGAALAAPAIAQERFEMTMVTSWPTGAPGVDDSARRIAARMTELSGGRLVINVFGAGEIVPAFGVFDAVSQGTADLYHSVPAYWISKSTGIGVFGSFPFGLTAPEQMAWMHHGGGQALYDRAYAEHGLKPFLAGNSGPQFFGWFRNEINTLDDMVGLRFRTTGFAGEVLRKVGVAAVSLPGGEIFPALQAGTIDAAEFIGPWNDFAFGFHQVAKNFYYPGIGEPSSSEEVVFNESSFARLPEDLQMLVKVVCMSASEETTTDYDVNHAITLRKMIDEHGVVMRRISDDIMGGLKEATIELVEELLASDDTLTRDIMESFTAFRNQTAEYAMYSYGAQMNARDFAFPTG